MGSNEHISILLTSLAVLAKPVFLKTISVFPSITPATMPENQLVQNANQQLRWFTLHQYLPTVER